ncbi:MAG: hypothetical protein AVDCRST_MAG49-4589, partial [uncultured Thermomicrobiales bacterium]
MPRLVGLIEVAHHHLVGRVVTTYSADPLLPRRQLAGAGETGVGAATEAPVRGPRPVWRPPRRPPAAPRGRSG